MGILRLLLAISVVVHHRDPHLSLRFLVGGPFAVQLFFVISGFYMALVLDEKYRGASGIRAFYGNRLLRLLPTYYVALLLIVLVPWLAGLLLGRPIQIGQMNTWAGYGAQLPGWLAAALKALNLSPLGQELPWAGVLDLTDHTAAFQAPAGHGVMPLYFFMLLPPAWSLSLELQFYALAPWLTRRSPALLAGLFVAALALHWLLPLLPFGNDEFWRNRNLPAQLGYFLLGMAGHRLYRRRTHEAWLGRLMQRGRWFWAATLALLAAYPWLPLGVRDPLVTGGFALALPFVFAATASWQWDRMVGELSYPLYLSHWLVNQGWYGLEPLVQQRLPAFRHDWVSVGVVVVISLGLAAMIHWFVERPVDRFRQRRARRSLAATPPPGP
jgi:peptidoglycan/LPS O-acetylase OafA/YrhL